MKSVLAPSLMLLVGCYMASDSSSPSRSTSPPNALAASTEQRPLVDHPEYTNWSRFAVGTSVVRQKEVANELGAVHVTTRLRLAEKTAEKVVVETQVTVARSDSNVVRNPPFCAEFPSKFRLPAGMEQRQFALPALKAMHVADEAREAAGREFQCLVFVWEERNETGPMQVKHWRCDEIPGRMVRQEINGHMHRSVEEITEVVSP